MANKRREDVWNIFAVFASVSFSAIFHCLFLLRKEYPFNQFMDPALEITYLMGACFALLGYIFPSVLYWLLAQGESSLGSLSKGDRTTAISLFVGVALCYGFFGLAIGFFVGFIIGVSFYGLS